MRGRRLRGWVVLAAICAASAGAHASEKVAGFPYERLFAGATFAAGVPTQQEMFGFQPGARPLSHDELLRYFRALAESSARAELRTYATSHEGRELFYLAVSDEATVADLDGFRERHARLADPRGRPVAEDAALVQSAKAVAWIAYAIHGDELSSADAAAAVAYWLVAGEDEAARRLRRELVVLIDPLENPDGRERFLAQTRSFAHAVPNPDGEDLSHTTVWPWGRGNHYLFDLNRDWISLVQPESARTGVIAGWNPQLMVDSHEMGADDTYLFPPSRHPFNPHLPAMQVAWIGRFAADQARALDRRGYPYYTREWNEEFFPGYGSSWASYLGAIGVLYEMSSTDGTLVKKRDGVVRTYAEAVEHHVLSSVANLTTLAEQRSAIVADFVAARRAAIGPAAGSPAAWFLPRGRHPDRVDRLVSLLQRQGLEVFVNDPGTAPPAPLRDARSGAIVPRDAFPERLYLVPLDQPASPLVRGLLDPHVAMEAGFLREEREYLERGKGTRLYESTAWSLPFAFDVDAWWSSVRPTKGWSPAAPQPAVGRFESADAPFGYLMAGDTDRSTVALAALLQQGVAVRVAEKPFRVDGVDWPRGSILIAREGQEDDLPELLPAIAERHAVELRAVPTALAQSGPDLGGRHFRPLVAPRVGVWAGWPVSPSSYGALWHLLDEELALRFNALDLARFAQVDLARYNVLVFPPASGGVDAYRAVLGGEGVARLRRWIEGGGTAVGIGDGAELLAHTESGLTRARLRRQALEVYPPVVFGPSAEVAEAAGTFRAAGLRAPAEQDDKAPEPRGAPYDVAPLIGAGARPFVLDVELGTTIETTPVDLAEWLKPQLPPGRDKPTNEDLARADERLRRFGPRGTFVRVELDPEHWLGWGVALELPALVADSETLVAEPPVQVVARFVGIERLHLGGLLWPEAAGRMAHTAYATREGIGRGQVVLFLNEPEFRGWTLGTRRLLVNALLYGPGLGTRWSGPW